jgi:cell division transport system permease protein
MPDRIDPLGLRVAYRDRLLPLLIAAQAFLAGLAIAGVFAASALAQSWQAAGQLTVQVIAPDDAAASGKTTRRAAVLRILAATPELSNLHELSHSELESLLRPWLGGDAASLGLPLPAVITAGWTGGSPDRLRAALTAAAPGTLLDTGAAWAARVAALTASFRACAVAVLITVAAVAAALVALATRAGLAASREAIAIIAGLGALDSDIAGRFAARGAGRAAAGAAAGALLALPMLLWLTALAAPFGAAAPAADGLPPALLAALAAVIPAAAVIGWVTTQLTVRGWLRGLG